MIRLLIDRTPVPWASPKVTEKVTYSPRQKEMETTIILLKTQIMGTDYYDELPLIGSLYVKFRFSLPMPQSWSDKKKRLQMHLNHTSKPDLCNLCKFYEDALQRANIIRNDSQICLENSIKVWAERGKVEIDIYDASYV
jgi:Holliday junction resolvase RusA-like endonuclease